MQKGIAAQGDAGGDPKASAALARLREKMLERIDDPHSVCFGRIDYADNGEYHIGPQGIRDGLAGPIVIVNWAAPIAKPYYEATPDDPQDLTLRRRFRTKRERLLGISDEVLAPGLIA
jgi:DNA helicase IV